MTCPAGSVVEVTFPNASYWYWFTPRIVQDEHPDPWADVTCHTPLTCPALYVDEFPSESVTCASEVGVKVGPWAEMPATVTATAPVEAAKGTIATIWVSLQLEIAVTGMVFIVTVLLLCAGPNPVPLIVTEEPISPVAGEILVMDPDSSNVNEAVLLVTPLARTVMGPEVAPDGTETVMLLALQEPTLATRLPNSTCPLP